MTKRRIIYWALCTLYGLVLTGVLLYLRFPADKFLRYCEHRVEERFPEISCTIADAHLVWPITVVLNEVRLKRATGGNEELLVDPELRLTPQLANPFRLFKVESNILGGHHQARMEYLPTEDRLILKEVDIRGLDLATMTQVHNELGRQFDGQLQLAGDFQLNLKPFQLIEAKGDASLEGGTFGLKKPILELKSLELEKSSVSFVLVKDTLELTKGRVKSSRLDTAFEGKVQLISPWLAGTISLTGEINPLGALYRERRQLRTVVARMQRVYKTSSLPFQVDGTIGRPTFRFGR